MIAGSPGRCNQRAGPVQLEDMLGPTPEPTVHSLAPSSSSLNVVIIFVLVATGYNDSETAKD
jgi:hypothetical protein